jgi:hypothetical protein
LVVSTLSSSWERVFIVKHLDMLRY